MVERITSRRSSFVRHKRRGTHLPRPRAQRMRAGCTDNFVRGEVEAGQIDRLRPDDQSGIFLSPSEFRSRVNRTSDVRSRPSSASSALQPPHTIFDEFFKSSTFLPVKRPNQPIKGIGMKRLVDSHGFLWFFRRTGITAGFHSRSAQNLCTNEERPTRRISFSQRIRHRRNNESSAGGLGHGSKPGTVWAILTRSVSEANAAPSLGFGMA